MIKQRFQALLDDSNKEETKQEDPYVLELLSQFRGGDGKRKVETLPAEKDESTAQMARDLLRSCFKVEEQAANIRSKVSGTSVRPTLVSSDFYGAPTSAPKPAKPLKTSALSKQERLVLASATQNEDQAEDAMLALSLLQQYKKDPSFIQRELKDQAKRRDQVLGLEQPPTKTVPQPSALFNPVLIQEERHRAINEKRDARKKEQRLRQLEESKERRIAKPMKEGLTKPGINRDIEPVMLHSGTTPVKRDEGMIDVERIKEAKLKIE